MKRFLGVSLVVAVVVGYAASQSLARGGHGGGHGGGHHGGGGHHAAGGHHGGHGEHHANQHHNNHDHHAHSQIVSHYGHNRPFSHGWYGHHPGAWGWGNGGYGWGNPWAAATFGAAAGWIGASALSNDGYGYPVNDTTVYTSDSGQPASDVADQSSDPSADDENSEVVYPAAEAAQLAASGATDPAAGAQYLPLGVYSIAPEGQNEASAMLHLAVSKDGVLRGSYYDLLSDKDHAITGAVDKKTGRVAWTVADNGKVVFHTTLRDLTEESGPLNVNFENGESREWTIARYVAEDGEAGPAGEAKTGGSDQS